MKTGGLLVTITPNARSEFLVRHGQHWLGLDPPRHLVLFNADNLAALAADVGFQDVQVKRTARAASLAHIASSGIANAGHYSWGKWPGWRLWFRAKALEAGMIRDVESGRAEGEEVVLIARK
jgi:hypothetical protein